MVTKRLRTAELRCLSIDERRHVTAECQLDQTPHLSATDLARWKAKCKYLNMINDNYMIKDISYI
jgi:hypothetical protein